MAARLTDQAGQNPIPPNPPNAPQPGRLRVLRGRRNLAATRWKRKSSAP